MAETKARFTTDARAVAMLALATALGLACAGERHRLSVERVEGDAPARDASIAPDARVDAAEPDAARATPHRAPAVSPAEGGFKVTLRADVAAACPGRCVSLRAEVSGGTAPFAYVWQTDLGDSLGESIDDGPGPVRVCPEADSTYRVTVTELGGGQEFRRATSTSRLVPFTAKCAEDDDAASESSGETALDAGVPPIKTNPEVAAPGSLRERCSHTARVSWGPRTTGNAPLLDGYPLATHVALSADDEAALSIGLGGLVDIDGQTLDALGGQYGLLVLRYAPDCRVRWSRTYGGLLGWAGGAAVAVYGERTVVAGNFIGPVDFGGAPLFAISTSGGVLLQLDGDGATLWARALNSAGGVHLVDVAAREDGTIAIAGFTYSDATIGAGQLVVSEGQSAAGFVAAFDRDGAPLWTFALSPGLDPSTLRFADDGDVVVLANGPDRFSLLRLDGRGRARFAVDELFTEQRWFSATMGLGTASDGTILLGHVQMGAEEGYRLSTHAADGDRLRSWLIPAMPALDLNTGAVGLTARDRIYDLTPAGAPTALGGRVWLNLRDAMGRVLARAELGDGRPEWPLDLAVGAHGELAAATIGTDADYQVMRLTLTRFERRQ